MKNLSEEIKSQAVELGLCDKWRDEWADDSSKDELVDKFIRGLDFCIRHDFPTTDVMREHFGDTIHRHGVYVDEKVEAVSQKVVVLNGSCDAELEYGDFDCARVWVRHTSKVRIMVGGFASVKVMVLDNSDAHIINSSCRKVLVYNYGGTVSSDGEVSVCNRPNPYKD